MATETDHTIDFDALIRASHEGAVKRIVESARNVVSGKCGYNDLADALEYYDRINRAKDLRALEVDRALFTMYSASRIMGAVVLDRKTGGRYAVVGFGEGDNVQRSLKADCTSQLQPSLPTDLWERWMTEEECKRHSIPYIDWAKVEESVRRRT